MVRSCRHTAIVFNMACEVIGWFYVALVDPLFRREMPSNPILEVDGTASPDIRNISRQVFSGAHGLDARWRRCGVRGGGVPMPFAFMQAAGR